MSTERTTMTHPLIDAYLTDLERALADADPRERAETLTTVREHITESLGDAPDGARVAQTLAGLGPVELIAAEATPATPTATPTAPATTVPAADHDLWVPRVALTAAVLSVPLVVLNFLLAAPIAIACLVVAIVHLRRRSPQRGLLQATLVASGLTLLATFALLVSHVLAAPNEAGAASPRPAQTVSAAAAPLG
ncbi:HAAS signaling domain-containing protein [Oerskovia paurometabola]|uniref:HAAS signaling domain-containing protein n=1 Tax=Oerskovia paurometabola TaxID=162170 RepID=UPI003447ED04